MFQQPSTCRLPAASAVPEHLSSWATILREKEFLNMECAFRAQRCDPCFVPAVASYAWALIQILLEQIGRLSLTAETRSGPKRQTKTCDTPAPGEAFMPSAIKCALC